MIATSTIVAGIVGTAMAGATVAGVTHSLTDHTDRVPVDPTSNVVPYSG